MALLSRNILIRGNTRSEPTDTLSSPECDAPTSAASTSDTETKSFLRRFDQVPCSGAYLTGFGGHLMMSGAARIAGVEFYHMGQTNVLGRYPVHFHRSESGSTSYATDCAVHRSFYRAFVVHDTQAATLRSNVAFDIEGHAFYLESGVEEQTVIEYNLAAHVHCIDGCAVFHASHPDIVASSSRAIPADAAASGFYISNAYNYVSHNAASGGWAGFHFPVLPEPADATIRFRTPLVEPSKRPVLVFSGNSAHSTMWWTNRAGAVYVGGGLFYTGSRDAGQGNWVANSASSELRYSPGRIGTSTAQGDFFPRHYQLLTFHNVTVALVGGGVSSWNFASEWIGLEAHDPLNQPAFALGEVWFDNFAVNCRSSNAAHVPLPSTRAGADLDHRFLLGEHLNVFRSYDHLTKHMLTRWTITNCGADKPYFAASDAARQDFCRTQFGEAECTHHLNGDAGGIWNLHRSANHPEVNIISSGIVYADAGGVAAVRDKPFFMGYMGHSGFGFGSYFQNWQDMDGSLSGRGVPTILGPSSVSGWWKLGDRAEECDDVGLGWSYPMWACDRRDRSLANIQISAFPKPQPLTKTTHTGSMTHFGRAGDTGAGSTLLFDSETTTAYANEMGSVSDSMPLGFQEDVVGPYEHSVYGGWYYWSAGGTCKHLKIDSFQVIKSTTLVLATSLPPGTLASQVHIYAQQTVGGSPITHEYTQAASLDEVRSHTGFDRWFHDAQTDVVFWRVIDVYITGSTGSTALVWSADQLPDTEGMVRGGLFLPNRNGGRSINVEISCTSTGGRYCDTMPVLRVPPMGCPTGHTPDSISSCNAPAADTAATNGTSGTSVSTNPIANPTANSTAKPSPRSIVRVKFTASGDVADFTPTRRGRIARAFATASAIDETDVNISVEAASVLITVSLSIPSEEANAVQTTLATELSSPSAATAFLEAAGVVGVEVLSTPSIDLSATDPSATDLSLWLALGAGVLGAVMIVMLAVGYMRRRRAVQLKSRKTARA